MSNKKVNETRLWHWLKKARLFYGPSLDITRVENSVQRGMPDVNGCLGNREFWLELKCAARPRNPLTKIKLRFEPQQIPWIKRRQASGGRAFVLLQVGSGHKANRFLIPSPTNMSLLEKEGMTLAEIRKCSISTDLTSHEIIDAAAYFRG